MDADRFDCLTRRLADAHTRRRVLRALVGGTVGLLLGASGPDQARAKNDASQFCKHLPPGQRGTCRSDAAKSDPGGLYAQCDGEPDRLCQATDGSFSCCTPPQTCGGGGTPGACSCTPTKTACGPSDCGILADGCGATLDCGQCPACHVCDAGTCQPLCGTGETCCDGRCVDFANDPANCGACGVPCPSGMICRNGTCRLPPICRSGVGDCAALGESCVGLPCCSGSCTGSICACRPAGQSCRDQYDCCQGTVCWEGACQTVEGEGDSCQSDADCDAGAFCAKLSPQDQVGRCDRCQSGSAGSGPYAVEDCPWPMPGFACGPDPVTGHPGFGYCCIWGESCAGDPCARPCAPDLTAQAGRAICPGLPLP